jgi:hypothetical protein
MDHQGSSMIDSIPTSWIGKMCYPWYQVRETIQPLKEQNKTKDKNRLHTPAFCNHSALSWLFLQGPMSWPYCSLQCSILMVQLTALYCHPPSPALTPHFPCSLSTLNILIQPVSCPIWQTSTMKMQTVWPPETSVTTYKTTLCHKPQGNSMNQG